VTPAWVGSVPPGPIAPIRGMVCEAGGDVDAVAGTVVEVETPWPVAWNSGAGAVPVVGKISVVAAASLVVALPRSIGCPFVAAAGTVPSRIEPAAPAAAAPASLSTSRRLCEASPCPLPFAPGRWPDSSVSRRALNAPTSSVRRAISSGPCQPDFIDPAMLGPPFPLLLTISRVSTTERASPAPDGTARGGLRLHCSPAVAGGGPQH
jgi:hypothetical protein